MAFAVTCKSCQARFLLNEDLLRRKVAGRIVTVRCRQCHAPIEVDASEVETPLPTAAAKPEPPGPPPAPPLKPALSYKAAPSPPRPAKSSTLIGIGAPSPARPEMVALSPGLLNMPAPAEPGPRGFPEPPPPPPSTIEELSGDWEVTDTETPLAPAVESEPESVDAFIEELPPSLPTPAEEELPSSSGTPSLNALTHHGSAPGSRRDDFFSDMMSKEPSGDTPPLELGAPTIDISGLDSPRAGKQTLPLFGMNDATPQGADLLTDPPRPAETASAPPAADRAVASQRPEGVRSRRNVVAPTTNSVPPPALSSRRSAVALPVLLLLAAAAGFLIWKRGSGEDSLAGRAEPTTSAEPPASPAAPTPAVPQPAAVAAAATTLTPAADDITFEKTPERPAAPTPAKPKAEAPSSAPPNEGPAAPVQAEPPREPAAPTPNEAPKPEVPAEPSGPFDRAAAAEALTAAASTASTCRKDGDPSGTASVVITFAASGRVTSATIGGPPFAGTATGGCIASALRKARVPAFEGERVTVSKTIVVQ